MLMRAYGIEYTYLMSWDHFGDQPFERGNLDAGRLSWLFGREIVPGEEDFDPASYEAMLVVDLKAIAKSFPEVLGKFEIVDGPEEGEDWA